MEKLIHSFDATAEDGTLYHLRVYQKWVSAGTFDDPNAKIPGMKRIMTSDGDHANYVEKGVYDVLTNGGMVRVTSDDPDAF